MPRFHATITASGEGLTFGERPAHRPPAMAIESCLSKVLCEAETKAACMEEAPQERGSTRHPPRVAERGARQSAGVVRGVVGERVALEIASEALGGVELRGVGRHQLDEDTGMAREEVADGACPVDAEAVPDHDQGAPQVAQQRAQELDQAFGVHVRVNQQRGVEGQTSAPRRHRDGGDHRHLVTRPSALGEDRGLAAGRPGAPHERRHQQADLVQEGQRRAQPRGVFFARGHSCRTQRRIAASSRSRAGRWGFCGENPSRRTRRPT